MIHIEERQTEKLPGDTSLFISFNYQQEIVDQLKSFSFTKSYDSKKKEWEVPITNLSEVLDSLCYIDDIELNVLETTEEQKAKVELDISKYKTKPYQYQLEGIEYGLSHDKWLLLDAPGLGKSLQALLLAQELKERENIEHCLIICGINSLKFNWEKEIKKHTDLGCTILGKKVSKNGRVTIGSIQDRIEHLKNQIDEFFIITNVESLRNNDIIKAINNDKYNKIDMIVFDECHTCKGIQAAQTKNLLKLTKQKYKLGMTGTLIMNNPLDCFVALKWIGKDRSTYTNFKNFFCVYSSSFPNIITGYKNMDFLKDEINSCSLRRNKDLLDLPEKTIIQELLEMDERQSKFYADVVSGIKNDIDKVNLNTTSVLSLVTRLRQVTACPSILTTEPIESIKINRAVELAEDIVSNGNKVVIFSTFKETTTKLADKLAQYSPLICTGDNPEDKINENVNLFLTDDNYKILIGTWQRMGTGLTLTSASYMIWVDTPWTDAAFEQGCDRIHRIGTTDKVFIYTLICKDTIDEKVAKLVNDKKILFDFMIDDKIDNSLLEDLKSFILDL